MILVVGGQGSGKAAYVKSLGYSEDDISRGVLDDKPILADMHLLLRDGERDGDSLLEILRQKEVVVCNEVGCGIVPMSPDERAWRDEVGRVCALAARHADAVVRLCCGIPQIIKGEVACG